VSGLRRIAAVSGASMKMIVRDRTAIFFSLLFPIIFMLLFGLLFRGSERPDIDVVGSGPLVTALARSNAVKLHPQPDASTAVRRVNDGKEPAALVVHDGTAHLYYAASATTEAPIVRGIVQGVADSLNLRASHTPPVVTVTSSHVESSSLSYVSFLVPGLLAMALCQSAVFGVAFTLVAYRQRGILRRLRLTPMPLWEFATGRVVMHLSVACAQAVVLLAVGRFAFGVQFVGSVFSLIPLVLVGGLCFISLGLLVGSIAKTEDAAAALSNVITLPMTFLAGVFFPLTAAPRFIQDVSEALPLTYLANGLRDVAVHGRSFASVVPDVLVLLGVTIGISLVSLRFFRWQTT